MKNRGFPARLRFALRGWSVAWRRESSFRWQVLAAAIAAVVWALGAASAAWWAALSLSVGAVLSAELANTALEHLADAVHPAQSPGIAAAKDCAAGAVLLASLAAAGVGAAFVWQTWLA